MTNPPPPELFPEPPAHSDFALVRSYRLRRIITCIVLAGLIGGGGYAVYAWKRAPAEIPTIKAEGPLKQKPEQPGGIDIPNQDVLAYQQIDNSGDKTPPVEHLLPPPETPQPAQPAAMPNAVTPPAPAIETLLAPAPPAPIVTTVTPQKPKPTSESQSSLAPAPEAAPVSAVVAQVNMDNPEPPAPPPAAAAQAPAPSPAFSAATTPETNSNEPAATSEKAGKKGFRVQLASFPDEDIARHQMAHMEKKYASQLGDARLHLAKADLGPRGIYYRVQSNPITDTEAREICGELKKLKAGCIVVKP